MREITTEPEPSITINGTVLTPGQACTVRVAIESFAMDLQDNGLGSDSQGKRTAELYLNNIYEIRRSMKQSV